ncbi:MAG: hypothetical protein WDM86_16315 [Rhizomicrobium sp.]
MTDSSVDSDAFAGILAAHPLAAAPDDKQRTLRRWLAGAAVLLVHVLALVIVAYSVHTPIVQRIRETIPEAILWVPKLEPFHPPKKVAPPEPVEALPFVTAPITLPPEPKRALPPPPSEGLEGVGRSLACGASSYENLSAAQRETCRRRPWAFVKRPDGTIVLDVPKPEAPPTAADIARHEQQTQPTCPPLVNVPCLGAIIHGDGDPFARPRNY